MRIDLSPEDQQKAEALVASGRFDSVEEAVRAGLSALESEAAADFPWSADLQQHVDSAIEAQTRGDFASDVSLDALFDSYLRKSA